MIITCIFLLVWNTTNTISIFILLNYALNITVFEINILGLSILLLKRTSIIIILSIGISGQIIRIFFWRKIVN